MSQIQREGTVSFHDASLHVWEEPGGPVMGEWELKFKRDVFKRIIQQLNRLGWTVGPWDQAEDFSAIANSHRTCSKGDLRAQLGVSGRHIELQMWQGVNTPTRPDHGGRYEMHKEAVMPYLLWLEMERTRRRIRDYLCNVFAGYEFRDLHADGRHAKRGPGVLTALQWVDQANRSSWHFDPELGHAPINMECNARSADGGTITHGARVYAIGYDGRVVVGTAYYNLNNMWWVVTGKYDVINVHSGAIYLESPGDLRQKRNERKRRRRLEGELSKAVKAMNFQRAETLKHILFPTKEPLYLIWHKGHNAYHRPGACGYTNSPTEAGKFTWEELGRFRPNDGSMEDQLSKIVPVAQEAKAA